MSKEKKENKKDVELDDELKEFYGKFHEFCKNNLPKNHTVILFGEKLRPLWYSFMSLRSLIADLELVKNEFIRGMFDANSSDNK